MKTQRIAIGLKSLFFFRGRLPYGFVVIVCLLGYFSTSCTNVFHQPPPPRPCQSAIQCVRISQRIEPTCLSVSGRFFYEAFNFHPSKVIRVRFRETIYYVNRPPGDPDPAETTDEIVRDIQPGNRTPVSLGCRFTHHVGGLPESFDEHTFTPISGELGGDPSTPSQIHSGPAGRCRVCVPPYCLHIDLRNSPDPNRDRITRAMSKSVGHLLSDVPLKSISITDLLALLPPFPGQADRDITFVEDTFHSGGSSDMFTVSFPLENVDTATVVIPASLKGNFFRAKRRQARRSFNTVTLTFDEADSIMVYYYDNQDQFLGSEYIKTIKVNKDSVMLTGSRRYCVKIDGPFTLRK